MDDRRSLHAWWLWSFALVALAVPARADWPSDPSQFVTLTPGDRFTTVLCACPDGIGGSFVSWSSGVVPTVLHVARLDELGRPSFPGGVVDLASGDGALLELAGDGVGGAVLLIQHWVTGTTAELWLRRMSSTGSVSWTTTVAGETKIPGQVAWAHVALEPVSRVWFVTWLDASGATDRVRVQCVDQSGQARWATTPTVQLPSGAHLSLGPLEPDGRGGAWVACQEAGSGDTTATVQHIGSQGTADWGPAGASVVLPFNYWIHQLAGDSQSNLWISIQGNETWDTSDRIQRLRPDGSASFGGNGIALPHPERVQRRQAELGITSSDHAFVAWVDAPSPAESHTELQAMDSSGTWLGTTRDLGVTVAPGSGGIRVYPLADGGAFVTTAPGVGVSMPVQRVDAGGVPQWPQQTSLMQPPLAMRSQDETWVPPFPTDDGGLVSFRTLADSVAMPDGRHALFVRAQHLDANGQHGVAPTLAVARHIVHGSSLLAPVPSPMTTSARVRFTLESEGDAELTLHDLSGRRVRTLARGHWSAGEHDVLLSRVERGSASLRSGLYWLRLAAGGRSEARELVVLD